MTWEDVTAGTNEWLSGDGFFYVLSGYVEVDYFEEGQEAWTEQTPTTNTWVTV